MILKSKPPHSSIAHLQISLQIPIEYSHLIFYSIDSIIPLYSSIQSIATIFIGNDLISKTITFHIVLHLNSLNLHINEEQVQQGHSRTPMDLY
jgi:hypothetical protein